MSRKDAVSPAPPRKVPPPKRPVDVAPETEAELREAWGK